MKSAVCLFVRDEARDIREWLAYQHVIGFDTCFVFDNGSIDGTADIVRMVAKVQDVRLIDWPSNERNSQSNVYQYALDNFSHEFDWMAFFDIDEFLVLHNKIELSQFLSERSTAGAIAINWAIFGSNGIREYPSGLVIENFTKRAPTEFGTNAIFKTIVATRACSRILNGHMVDLQEGYFTADGLPLETRKPGKMIGPANHTYCQLNHYFVRSWKHWQAKIARGYRHTRARTEDEFRLYDRNDILDESALRHIAAVRSQIDLYRN